MNIKTMILLTATAAGLTLTSCKTEKEATPFKWQVDQFADVRIMRYQIPEFDSLTPNQKVLVYYLSEAAKCGRDIIWDQNYKYNLTVRSVLESIYNGYTGDRNNANWEQFMVYLKRVWFSNGIHHHYSNDKFIPEFTQEYFAELVKNTPADKFNTTLGSTDEIITNLTPILFDPNVATKRVNQDAGVDMVAASACNYYEGVTQKEVEDFYAKMMNPKDTTPISYGLNSKLVKENGKVIEKVWKIDGMYGAAIAKIVYWLEKAATVAENEHQRNIINTLIEYYKSGDLKKFDEYNVLWVSDVNSHIDFVNGFIENYGDPMGYKSSWEAVVNFKNLEATRRTTIIGDNAQWFEDNSPIDEQFKKKEVKGVSAKVITVAQLGGDCYPTTPIGINLPNADWIRKYHGSKSVTMDNITYAYDQAAQGNGFMEEFAWSPEEIELSKQHGSLAGNLHTDLHECLGHGSGQLAEGVKGDELKNYGSPLEEARADLFALYYMMDEKMVEIGIMPTLDVAKAEYNNYIRNGLMTQLTRIEFGKTIEQAHMRNRQLIASWCYENGKAENVIEKKTRDGKTYFVINDYAKLRNLFGTLLKEIQRIKSTGDYEAGKKMVETYAVQINPELHREVLDRFNKLKLAPYGGFMNPQLVPVMEGDKIVDIKVEYPENYVQQMLDYSNNYGFLPLIN
ncbi:MAG TPA: dihydrofolate reductase [Tenuifilaceae bacterium]|nr:dihydrofolate reductase [Tenuifilaceae bacterium]HPI45261.1 dihydrofolate reductase [Tenuifilaceae bacterium]HPN21422.1 dihydrofolate reductase [Tenuifilaceae bacterium]